MARLKRFDKTEARHIRRLVKAMTDSRVGMSTSAAIRRIADVHKTSTETVRKVVNRSGVYGGN